MKSSKKIDNHSGKNKSKRELDDEFYAAQALAETAQAQADEARAKAANAAAEADKAIDARDPQKWRGDSQGKVLKERIRAEYRDARELLVEALGMFGSDKPGERASAAFTAERLRAKLGMTWNQLIVREDDDDEEFDDNDEGDDDDHLDDDAEPVA